MKINYILFVLIIMIGYNSYSQQPKVKPCTYTALELGWSIIIPKGYNLKYMQKNRIEDIKGKDIKDEFFVEELNLDDSKLLTRIQYNKFNYIDCTIRNFSKKTYKEYQNDSRLLKKSLYNTYAKHYNKIDSAFRKSINIDGYNFNVFYLKKYNSTATFSITQIILNTLINEYDFRVIINYNNEADKKLMFDALKNSTFK